MAACSEWVFGQTGPIDGTDYNPDGRANTINTAVPFLRISPDARSGAMGDAGIAISPDANATFWNLAKLPFATSDAEASVTYTPWLKELVDDVFLAYLSGYKQLDETQAVGASLRYFDLGSIQFRDMRGEFQGNFHPREFSFDVGYARKLTDEWSLGVALRYIYSNLASGASRDGVTFKPGNAVAGDISAFYTHETDYYGGRAAIWNFGITITNIGTKIAYSNDAQFKNFIPTNLGIGGAYTYQFDEYNKLTFALDINKLLVPTPDTIDSDGDNIWDYKEQSVVSGIFSSFGDAPGGFHEELNELMYSIGAEYWYNDLFAIRAGYFNENKHKGDRKFFTLGLGLKYDIFGINFSYLVPSGSGVQRNPLSNTLRFSLIFDLGTEQ
jgi:hypothetical protein